MTVSDTNGAHRTEHDHCLAPGRITDAPAGGAGYGRLFADLPALSSPVTALESAGEPGGVCDAAAALQRLAERGDHAREAAGWPFFGQLIAHDVTADRSPVGPDTDVASLRSARSPKLNLEMVYGDGPTGHPYLHELTDPASLLLGDDGWDLPRNRQGVALVGDPRNDVHPFVNRLHLALLHAHNGLVQRLRADGTNEADLYAEARRALTWHYQWVVVHDFVPRLTDRSLVGDVLARGGRHYAPATGEAFLPLKFADAAYRYGHGEIRYRYRLNAHTAAVPLFPDLVGFLPVRPEHRIDLSQLFDLPGHPPAQRARRMDGSLPASLIGLPHQITGTVADVAYRWLAVRDLLRGHATALPFGETIAAGMHETPLSRDEIGPGWPGGTPLWFYLLKEAQHRGDGDRLGPVGVRIVTEVLIGLLRADPGSYLTASPRWRPPARRRRHVHPSRPARLLLHPRRRHPAHRPLPASKGSSTMTRIAIVGAGHIGGNLARLFRHAGHEVTVSFAQDERKLHQLIDSIDATAASPADAVRDAEVVVVSVPWGVDDTALTQAGGPGALAGKVVIDTTNQFGQVDGRFAVLDLGGQSAAATNAAKAPGALWVKAFNTLTAGFQASASGRTGPDRVVMFYATNHDGAAPAVEAMINDAGFDPVRTGALARTDVGHQEAKGELYGEEFHRDDALAAVARLRGTQPAGTGRP